MTIYLGPPEEARKSLIAWWKWCQDKPFMYAELCIQLATDGLRLAWGIELLARGSSLFQCRGMRWLPVEAGKVNSDPGLAYHLALLEVGRARRSWSMDSVESSTWRSIWRLFEVAWEGGEQAGECSGVRVANIVQVR